MTDRELLMKFRELHDRAAMDALVRRYVDLVYASARRQVADAHLAEDVTQAVFLTLARKARSIPPDRLAGWLFNTTRYAACNARKIAARREHHERQTARQRTEMLMDPETPADPHPLLDDLDAAIASLKPADRDAIIARYLRGQGVSELGQVLGISEAAVRKRLDRAVEKLQRFFVRRGIGGTATASIIAAMTLAASQKASAASVVMASSAALGSAPPTAVSIAHAVGVAAMMVRVKLAGAIAATAVLLMFSGVATFRVLDAPATAVATAPTSVAAPAMDDAHRELDLIRAAFLPNTQRYACAYRSEMWVERNDIKGPLPPDHTESRIYRDGDNLDVLDRITTSFVRPKPMTITTRLIAANSFVETSTEAEPDHPVPPKRGLFNPDGPGMRHIAIAYIRGGNMLEGYFAGDDERFCELLKRSNNLRVATELESSSTTRPVSDLPMLHISGDTPRGTYDLWCDPATHVLRHARVVKHKGDTIWHNVTVGFVKPPDTSVIDESWFEMTLPAPRDSAVSTMPNDAQYVEWRHYTNGKHMMAHTTAHRVSFQDNPDFVALGAFQPDLPDGAPMVGLNLPGGGRFTWHAGTITMLPGTSPPGSLQAALRTNLPADVMPSKWTLMPSAASTHSPTSIAAIVPTMQPPAPRVVPVWMIAMSALGGLSLVFWVARALRRTAWRGS